MSDINELISKEALDSVNKLQATFTAIVATLDQLIAKSTNLDKLLGSMKGLSIEQDKVNKSANDAVRLNKQLRDSEDEVVKAKIRFQQATKELTTEMKNQVAMEKAASDSMVAMKIKLAELKNEWNNASKVIRDQMAPGINDLTNKIKAAEQAIGTHSRSVGSYTEAIKASVLQMLSFGGVIYIAKEAIGKLYDAFLQTEAGAKFQGTLKQISRTFTQNLIPAIKEYWGYELAHNDEKAGKSMLDFFKKMADSAKIAKDLDALRIKERDHLKEIAQIETDIKELRLKAEGQSGKEQLTTLETIDKKEDEITQKKQDHLNEYITSLKSLSKDRKNDTDLMNELNTKEIELIQVKGEKNLRVASKINADNAKIAADKKKAIEDEIKADEKMYKEIDKSSKESFDAAKGMRDDFMKDAKNSQKKHNKDLEKEYLGHTDSMERVDKDRFGKVEAAYLQDKISFADYLDAKMKLEISNTELTEGEILAIKAKYAKLIKDGDKKENKETQEIEKAAIDLTKTMEEGYFNYKKQKLDDEMNHELDNKNLTEEQRLAITKKYKKQQQELDKKQVMIDTALAVINVWAHAQSWVQGLIENIAVLAEGGWAYNQVANQSFATGTQSSPEGFALVGEQGRELIIDPSGKIGLSGDSAEMRYLKQGTKIVPSDETKRIMAAAAMSKRDTIEQTIERGNKELINAIKNKKEFHFNVGVGRSIVERDGETYKTYFERHLS